MMKYYEVLQDFFSEGEDYTYALVEDPKDPDGWVVSDEKGSFIFDKHMNALYVLYDETYDLDYQFGIHIGKITPEDMVRLSILEKEVFRDDKPMLELNNIVLTRDYLTDIDAVTKLSKPGTPPVINLSSKELEHLTDTYPELDGVIDICDDDTYRLGTCWQIDARILNVRYEM